MFRSGRTLASFLAVFALFTGGCVSAPEMFGSRARYSPAYGGYVMAKDNGSDDPGPHDPVLLLRDPLTGSKLHCQKDVFAWRELYEDIAVDRAEDEDAAIATGITTGALFGPLLVVHPMGALVLADALLTADSLYADLASESAVELFARGIRLYRRQRDAQATALIERALAKDASIGVGEEAYLYLGLAHRRLGNTERARVALSLFVDRAAVRDVDAYRAAEAALRAMGVRRAPCASTDPVALHW